MEPLRRRLQSGEILVGDGAIGTQLMERGLEIGQCPEAINLERPEVLAEIAELYLEAGAEILTTNTFGGSPLKLRPYSLEERTEEINQRAVEALRGTVQDHAYLSGSIGPCGGILEPYGDLKEDLVRSSFERQIAALAAAGVDLLCIETMIDLREAILAVSAAKAIAPELPVAATLTFEATPRGFFTIMGNTVEQAAAGLEQAGAEMIGTNCGNGIDKMIEIALEFTKHSHSALVVQSNAGLPENRGGEVVYPETPEYMAERIGSLIEAGIAMIGGCCGTTPQHIRAIRERVDAACSGV